MNLMNFRKNLRFIYMLICLCANWSMYAQDFTIEEINHLTGGFKWLD